LTIRDSAGGGNLVALNTSPGSTIGGTGAGINSSAGTLIIESGTLNVGGTTGGAGIGGGAGQGSGNIYINGGIVHSEQINESFAAAIGSGVSGTGNSNIIINGGIVTAISSPLGGAGIGNGGWFSSGTTIIINGGDVTATGGLTSAGIGSGWGNGGSVVEINGGTINATGGPGAGAAGIGRSGDTANPPSTVNVTGNPDITTHVGDPFPVIWFYPPPQTHFTVVYGSITNNLNANAHTSDGTLSFEWYQVGVGTATTTNPYFAIPTGLGVGTHTFQVTTSNRGTISDTITITVEVLAYNEPPPNGDVPSRSRGLWLQTGENARQGVILHIDALDAYALGLRDNAGNPYINVNLESGADISRQLDILDAAMAITTSQRSRLGAMQNRLKHTVNKLSVASENLSASNSRIRDADMAHEMMRLTTANVLQQAAVSMLAQANQQAQNVLWLLQ
jgi:flagellin-like hook-associated protein FlgL